ncbi:MAG: energy-coupled thiamine transporter ThiT [Clostridia bacterium]|nr:energy-coupled thiamine transporter ThiT [Clostridia bacterium]
MKHTNTQRLVESALMIAVATVLSLFKLAELPYGGSITLASMLPLVILSYRHGLGVGLGSALTYGVLQQLLGLKNLTYFTTPLSVVALVVLDYLLAFAVCGLGGILRRAPVKQSVALSCGAALACVLRYLCHVVSGATVWAGLSIPTSAALVYSFIYNATYMLPETLVTVLAAYYLGGLLDFSRTPPVRLEKEATASPLQLCLGVLVLGCAIYDIAAIFSHMQHPKTGEFWLAGLAQPWLWISVGAVTLIGAGAVLALTVLRKKQTEGEGAA